MRKFFTALLLLAVFMTYGCRDKYDDSALWKDIDNIHNSLAKLKGQITELNNQMTMISAIVSGGVITNITTNAQGECLVSYKGSDNVEHTITIATKDDVITAPIIDVKQEGGTLYWTQTVTGVTSWVLDTDGSKIPVSGRAPIIEVDAAGFWTVNGVRINDSTGAQVKAEGKQTSLITGVEIGPDGNATITLGNGQKVTAQVFSAFNINFNVEATTKIGNTSQILEITYELIGERATDAIVDIVRTNNVSAQHNAAQKKITVSFAAGFEQGNIMVMVYDMQNNTIIKPLAFTTLDDGPGGISTADDLVAFSVAVNSGASLSKWIDRSSGSVVLLNDIDMAGVTSWIPIGGATASTATPNTAVAYTPVNAFSGVFDGKGHAIKNINWTFAVGDAKIVYGLFGALTDATVKNLTLGTNSDNSRIALSGAAIHGVTIGSVAGYNQNSTIESCKSYVDIAFAGTDAANTMVAIGGICGSLNGGTIGGVTQVVGCANYGEITCGSIVNTGSGANGGMHVGGICAVMMADTKTLVRNCTNHGAVSAPSGRGGGIAAVGAGGTVEDCVNEGLIQDDINGVFALNTKPYNLKRMGGLVGGTGGVFAIKNSINNGNIFSQLGCRTGGFVGHNASPITGCTNNGIILSDFVADGTNKHGAGWACGYNDNIDRINGCSIGTGKVGDYSAYKSAPMTTPVATYSNAVCHGPFSPANNGISNIDEDYYAWSEISASSPAQGVSYKHYSFKNVAQHIYVVELDLNNPNVEITTALADDLVPNPNGNNNSNNGKNLRETLSEVCTRKRADGMNIVAGINSGFFNSHDGFPRGVHVENGEPAFINNPVVRRQLTNHAWGFTMFKDRSLSFGVRDFKGLVQVDGTDYEYFSVNDTIVRLNDTAGSDANLYTSRLKAAPHPTMSVPVGSRALFIVGSCSSPMLVNEGWADATVSSIVDGRGGESISIPYVRQKNEWVLQVTGEKATELAAKLSVGKSMKIRANITIDANASSAPIVTHNASMYRFLYNGVWNDPKISSDPQDPATIVGASEDNKKVYFVAVDGRTTASLGLNYYELYRVAKKLGCHNSIRYDGGGSTTMWLYQGGVGSVVNQPCDTKGERSCMNYLLIKIKN